MYLLSFKQQEKRIIVHLLVAFGIYVFEGLLKVNPFYWWHLLNDVLFIGVPQDILTFVTFWHVNYISLANVK